MLKDFIAKETDVTKGTVYISGILTAEDNGTEVTGTGLCQPVYFLLDSGSSRFILIGLKLRASSDMSMSSSLWLSCSAFCAAFALWKSMKIIAA